MNENVALSCFECAVKTEGQLDLLLSLLAKLQFLKMNSEKGMEGFENARTVVITGMTSVLNQVKSSLNATHEEEFGMIIEWLEKAIFLVKNDEFYEAGVAIMNIATYPTVVAGRAIRLLSLPPTRSIW